jgi:hypothetical protein
MEKNVPAPVPAADEELSERELEGVAGGMIPALEMVEQAMGDVAHQIADAVHSVLGGNVTSNSNS